MSPRIWPQPLIVSRDLPAASRFYTEEIWLRDPDGYLGVVAGPSEYRPRRSSPQLADPLTRISEGDNPHSRPLSRAGRSYRPDALIRAGSAWASARQVVAVEEG